MLATGVDSDLYRTTLVLHVLAVVVGFGSAIVWSALGGRTGGATDVASARAIVAAVVRSGRVLTAPFIWAAVVLGYALVGFSDGRWQMSDTWVSIAGLVGIVAGVTAILAHVMRSRYARLLTAGDGSDADAASARGRAEALSGVVHLALVVNLVLMVWQPGS